MMYIDIEQAVQYLVSCTQMLNKVFNIEYDVRRSEIEILSLGVRRLGNVFGWSAPLFFEWLSSQPIVEQSVQY